MKKKYRNYKKYLINPIFPAAIFGSVTGILTAVVVNIYKLMAKYIISFSEAGYGYLRGHLYWVPLIVVALFGIAALFSFLYKHMPNLKGGGIPTSIGILRGIITFKWLRNLIGTFFMSLSVFLVGVPLGNEGPSVQMGTAIGRGSVYCFGKKHRAWDRYSMTGGACAGFNVATGAPISGIMFALEEAHQRISPMIIIVACTSVMFSSLTTELLAPVLGVSISLFPKMELMELSAFDVWIPLVIGVAGGLFAVIFLKYYRRINAFFTKRLSKLPRVYKIFFIFLLTLALGLCSFSFVSTGHELMLELFDGELAIYMLLLILLVRSTLTLSANCSGLTGGIFMPIIAIGTVLASVLGKAGMYIGLEQEYYTMILVLGITACISGMMKMPITAIIFSVEALSCYGNIIHVVIVSIIAFVITEMFDAKSINDSVLESRVELQNKDKAPRVIDTFVTVKKGSFAVGKQIRDILWPSNLFVLSVQHDTSRNAEVDEHGGKALRERDVLHVRYSTTDEALTRAELTAIVGEQDYHEKEADVI